MSEVNMPARPPVLDVSDLSVAYGERTVVDGVSFQLHRGEIFGLLGPNGAGKTSTLSAIEGLVKPKSGRQLADGINVGEEPLEAKARLRVQLPSSFQAELTIQQIARLYGGLYGVNLSREQIGTSIRSIGLEEELGKVQTVVGRAAAAACTVHCHDSQALPLLLDEPTAGLDPQSRRGLGRRIEELVVRATAFF